MPTSLLVTLILVLSMSACGGEDSEATALLGQQLIEAARVGDAAEVRALLERDADVQARDANGATALVAAAYGNHIEAARLLVEADADVNAKDESEQSAYLIATSEVGDDVTLLDLTLEHGAQVNAKDSYNGTGLIRAAERGYEAIILGEGGERHTNVVRRLVAAGADVNFADGQGVTPFAHAHRQGFSKIVEILEQAGARG